MHTKGNEKGKFFLTKEIQFNEIKTASLKENFPLT